MTFQRVAIIGLGLIGGSLGLALAEDLPGVATSGYDIDPKVRTRARERGLAQVVHDDPGEAVKGADLVVLCVPVGAMRQAAASIAADLSPMCVISDVGSSKRTITDTLQDALPGFEVIPAHPVAGTENSGPDAGFSTLFHQRWCIVTPPAGADKAKVAALVDFWESLEGMRVQVNNPVATSPTGFFSNNSEEIWVLADDGAGAALAATSAPSTTSRPLNSRLRQARQPSQNR